MRRKNLSIILLVPLFVVWPGVPSFGQRLPNLGEIKQRLIQYKKSGAYERDIAKVTTKAQKFIEKRAPRVNKPAMILDIDETSLSNWVELVANDFGYFPGGTCDSLPAGPCGVHSWELSARADAIAPTLTLYKAARAKGVAVFFISGRPVNEQAATEENLRKVGYDGWAGMALKPIGDSTPVDAFKTAERKKIAAQGFTIIANIADQPSDLRGGYAERTFLIPDPFYRIP